MSLNPMLGHLYHDYSITNNYTALDVKEKMKTREINAREAKYLQKYSHILDKAKRSCQTKNECEQRRIRKQLKNIKTKTVSLDRGLKRESQRLKLFDDVLPVKSRQASSGPMCRQHKNINAHDFVSAKSLYSQKYSDQTNSGEQETADTIKKKGNIHENDILLSKTRKLLRKADHVTKSLHTLYTSNLERRWKGSNRTILDVLSSETDEELERALFVLRGTQAGTLIEDILRERAWTRRAGSDSHGRQKWSISSVDSKEQESDPVFVTEIAVRDGMEKMKLLSEKKSSVRKFSHESETSEQQKSENIMHVGSPNIPCFTKSASNRYDMQTAARAMLVNKSAVNMCDEDVTENYANKIDISEGIVSTEPSQANFSELQSSNAHSLSNSVKTISDASVSENKHQQWINVADVNLDLNNIFQRDSSNSMSSTAVNPSESEYVPTLKWREIFKTPAVWKQNRRAEQTIKKAKDISLVKVHGQYRQTMLK